MTNTENLLAATKLLNVLYDDAERLIFIIYPHCDMNPDEIIKHHCEELRHHLYFMQSEIKALCTELLLRNELVSSDE